MFTLLIVTSSKTEEGNFLCIYMSIYWIKIKLIVLAVFFNLNCLVSVKIIIIRLDIKFGVIPLFANKGNTKMSLEQIRFINFKQ